MTRKNLQRAWMLSMACALVAGVIGGWSLHATLQSLSPEARQRAALRVMAAAATSGETDDRDERHDTGSVPTIGSNPISEVRGHRLLLPIEQADVSAMRGSFGERRGGGSRGHEAVDILAPRNTPIRAVEDGTIAKLFLSRLGGLTIYQFDATGRFCYYYAHLQRYADDLKDGQDVRAGQVIGYVGTSGNAPPNTPHLHFAIFELTNERQWWNGRPIDPYDVFNNPS